MSTGIATVKQVLSGDSVVLVGKSTNGPPQEMTITLSSLQAPRLSKGPQNVEEPFAWESREFLRRLCIGKNVSFNVVNVVSSINRTFGDIDIISPPLKQGGLPTSISMSKAIVEAGYASVKSPSRDDKNSSIYDELVVANLEAKEAKLGMYSTTKNPIIRSINWAPTSADIETIFNKLKGIPTRVVIEGVKDGSSLRILLLEDSPNPFTYIPFSLAGLICPRINTPKTDQAVNTVTHPEPYSLQSRVFSELRLLNREINVIMQGLDRMGNVLGTVLHPKGNISIEILKNGLAKISDRSLAFVPKNVALEMKLAEAEAKSSLRFIWETHSAFVPEENDMAKSFEGTVIEVLSGDTIIVVETLSLDSICEAKEAKVTFSSIRIPKQARNDSTEVATSDECWAAQSKDILRQRLVGRNVTVCVEYEKSLDGDKKNSKRMFATVYVGNNKTSSKNVALMMISEGLATCIKHRPDEQRSVKYDSLLLAEADAIAKGKGMHGTVNPPPIKNLNDVSNDSKKAKALLAILPKSRYRAVIDYVFSGSRFKITIPSENITLQLSLNQIRTPMPSKNASSGSGARAGEAFAEESKKLSRWQLMQRTVDIHIDNSDKNGIALGRIYLLPSNECYGGILLSNGYGKIDRFMIDSDSIEINKFIEIQNISKASKIGIWSLEQEEVEIEENNTEVIDSTSNENNKDGFINIRLSEIVNGTSFYYQEKTDSIDQKLSQVTNLMATFAEKRKEPLEPMKPKKGNNCAALFDDGSGSGSTWFRAKIEDINKDKEDGSMQILVHFIDFGNKDLLPLSSVSDIDQSYFSIPALAKQASLSFLQSASDDLDFGSGSIGVAASRYFGDLCWGDNVDLFMKIISKDFYKNSQVVLYDAEEMKKYKNNIEKISDGTFSEEDDSAISVNEKIVMEGFARKSSKLIKNASRNGLNNSIKLLLAKLDEAQSIAKNNRKNMFSYGDPGDSDDEREDRREDKMRK